MSGACENVFANSAKSSPAPARITPSATPTRAAIGLDQATPAVGPEVALLTVRATRSAVDPVLAAAVPAETRLQLRASSGETVFGNSVDRIGAGERTIAALPARPVPVAGTPAESRLTPRTAAQDTIVAKAANGIGAGERTTAALPARPVPVTGTPAEGRLTPRTAAQDTIVAKAANGIGAGERTIAAAPAKPAAFLDKGPVVRSAPADEAIFTTASLDRRPVAVAKTANGAVRTVVDLRLTAPQPAPPAQTATSAEAIAPPRALAVPRQALALGESLTLDRDVPAQRGKAADAWPCIDKKRGAVRFCVEAVQWPAAIDAHFDVGTTLYTGAKAVVRYDAERATSAYALFDTDAFETVSRHFTERFGEPTTRASRTIAPLAKPRIDNPVLAWRDTDPTSNRVASLEIREFDDARGGFPDLRYGVVLLRWETAHPIFPLVSALDLMMLK